MRGIYVAFLLISYALAASVEKHEKRKFQPVDCPDCGTRGRSGPDGDDCSRCDDPCDDCDGPRVTTKTYTPVHVQKVVDRTILVCSPSSYFARIEYDGCYEWNTTCSGVIAGTDSGVSNIYTGIRVESDGTETVEQLNAKHYRWITTNNQGNAQTWEEARLEDCKCNGDVLRASSSWVAVNDQLTGCCADGVNHQQSTAYQLKIYGECCSDCYLLQASIAWARPIKNNH